MEHWSSACERESLLSGRVLESLRFIFNDRLLCQGLMELMVLLEAFFALNWQAYRWDHLHRPSNTSFS